MLLLGEYGTVSLRQYTSVIDLNNLNVQATTAICILHMPVDRCHSAVDPPCRELAGNIGKDLKACRGGKLMDKHHALMVLHLGCQASVPM